MYMYSLCIVQCAVGSILKCTMCHPQCMEGEVFVVEGEDEKSSSKFDTTFLEEKSNLNRSDH